MKTDEINRTTKTGIETGTFGAGCFWCVEAIYQQIRGVIKVIPGYSGGLSSNPSYAEVSNGSSGHAEVCQIIFDSEVVSFDELLEVFWLIHDPTSLNRQGNDVGSQYRSVIFFHNDYQKTTANEYKQMLNQSFLYPKPVITEIVKFSFFYKAEPYHQNYYHQNYHQPYCLHVIQPKINQFRKVFRDKLKTMKPV